MAHVIVLDSLNEDVFVCGICKAVFNTLQTFLDHKSMKCSSTMFEENIVGNSTIVQANVLPNSISNNVETIQQGIELFDTAATNNKQTVQNEHVCLICKKKFKKLRSLLTHMKVHNDKPYQCLICGRCFIQNSHLQRHITTHKIWPDGITHTTPKNLEAELLSYNCTYCNVVLPSYSNYRAHLKHHLNLKKFRCIQNDCLEFYDTVTSLIEHVSLSHNTVTYTCHICTCNFNSLEDIATHQHNHSQLDKEQTKKLYKCTQCDAEFRKPEKLSLHMFTENHKKTCIHCSKTFASDKRLRLHLQIHKEQKPFQCNICDRSFHMKKYLSTHMLKHGSRQFKCPVCKNMFKRSDLLQRHMGLHQAKKKFKCPFKDSLDCRKEFSRNDKLKNHLKCHTNYLYKNKQKELQNKKSINSDVNMS